MLAAIMFSCLQQGAPEIRLECPSLLLQQETRVILELRAGEEVPAAQLRLWLPPDLRIAGVEGPISLAAGAVLRKEVELVIEPWRPATPLILALELVDSEGLRLVKNEHQVRTALGRDLIRWPFEARGVLPEVVGDLRVNLVGGDAAHGFRSLRMRANPGEQGRLLLWRREDGRPPLSSFPVLSFYLRNSQGQALSLALESNRRKTSIDLSSGSGIKAMRAIADPSLGENSGWQRLLIRLDERLDSAQEDLRLESIQLLLEGGEDGSEVDIDDFAVSRDGEILPRDKLGSLTQAFHASAPESGEEIDRMATSLARIDPADLAPRDRVDHALLDHALGLAGAELDLPKKARGEPASERRFAALLQYRHHLDIAGEDLRELGMQEVRRHQSLLDSLAGEVDPGKSWRQVAELLKERHPSAESLPVFAASAMNEAMEFSIQRQLLQIPRAARDARIQVVTDGRRSRTYPFGGYGGARPSPDGYRGTYFVSPPAVWMNSEESRDRLRGNHRAWTRVVALHEIVPGHHLQTVVHRMRPLSPFRRSFYSTVFAEGWALYCEEMMFEAGFFPDADTRFTQLHMRLWRAARMVIDASIHGGGMSLAAAEAFLVEEVAFDPINARAEVLRYVDNPTRPMSYLLGYIMISDLIKDAERAAGGSFEISQFRDLLLSFGPIPIPVIRIGLGL